MFKVLNEKFGSDTVDFHGIGEDLQIKEGHDPIDGYFYEEKTQELVEKLL